MHVENISSEVKNETCQNQAPTTNVLTLPNKRAARMWMQNVETTGPNKRFLIVISSYWRDRKHSPSVQEIADRARCCHSTVERVLTRIRRDFGVTRHYEESRVAIARLMAGEKRT